MWIDKGDWKTLDASMLKLPKTKNGRKHELPITRSGDFILPQARTFLKPGSAYLFPSSKKPGAPRTFRSLTQAVRRYCKRAGFKPFTPRDIRRTMKTHLLEADIAQTDVDIWHNHGRNADVARKNYDRANYEQAKSRVRDAIDRIVDQLERR